MVVVVIGYVIRFQWNKKSFAALLWSSFTAFRCSCFHLKLIFVRNNHLETTTSFQERHLLIHFHPTLTVVEEHPLKDPKQRHQVNCLNTVMAEICWNSFLLLPPERRNRENHTWISWHAVAILRGGGWIGLGSPRFLLNPPFGPPVFFFNLPFKFVWLTYAGLPNAFCKNTGHFVNSARSKLCHNS